MIYALKNVSAINAGKSIDETAKRLVIWLSVKFPVTMRMAKYMDSAANVINGAARYVMATLPFIRKYFFRVDGPHKTSTATVGEYILKNPQARMLVWLWRLPMK